VAAVPLVSVLLAVADGERYVKAAVRSILGQTTSDLELLVVDDASTDGTPAVLEGIRDPRLQVLRNDERVGLAASLNRALDEAGGRYVARLDADDVALPRRLERQLARIRATPGTIVLGTAVCELAGNGSPGMVHAMPATPIAVRWHLLFSSPFFHPTVLVEREALERGRFRYDPTFLESEDYDLWSRMLAEGEGANLSEALVLYRVHPAQASRSRRELQRSFQLRVALREIARVAPDLSEDDAELAWRVGAGEPLAPDRVEAAAAAYVQLARRFDDRFPKPRDALGQTVARPLVHAARRASGDAGLRVLRRALELDPALPAHALTARWVRLSRQRTAHRAARAWLEQLEAEGERERENESDTSGT
jgi:GT2 family glycosyltransferase